jgi:hypothetical protein
MGIGTKHFDTILIFMYCGLEKYNNNNNNNDKEEKINKKFISFRKFNVKFTY